MAFKEPHQDGVRVLASRDFYEMGLAAYRERRWEDAESAFKSSLALIPDDGPSLTLLTRVEGMETAHLSVDWDGSWRIAK
ncbi:tetratricopeptide repeat protein [Rhizobium sp. NZLR1b]|uniref:hypothetical protein n=1 Tax=Rhizobium sp. NZLR1b TaxID=2731099 RepID=UPI001C8371CA|nr:hypothetical protein [Rhizobium sp. NZLR1b]MBX5173576.1 tetratricopeptide repeat protein [Rhizobium sp. NZLR1b]